MSRLESDPQPRGDKTNLNPFLTGLPNEDRSYHRSVLPVSEPRSQLLTENRRKVDELHQRSLEHDLKRCSRALSIVWRIKIVFTVTTLTANEF